MREIQGVRVLIIEDQPIIALALADAVAESGATVAGTASTLDRALALANKAEADVALLDLWLGDVQAYGVGEILSLRGIPFIVISGVSKQDEPETIRDAPRLIKPFKADELIAAIRAL